MRVIRLPDDFNHTTARFRRSTLEAWQQDHAPCVERPRPNKVADVLMACVLGLLGAVLLVHWLSR